MRYKLKYKALGITAVLIEWPAEINEAILYDILAFEKLIKEFYKNESIETIPIYHSLTLIFNTPIPVDAVIQELKTLYKTNGQISITPKTWKLPVCYDASFGIDTESLAMQKQLSIEDFITLHTKPNYTVYGIGFLPGFLYLGGLLEQLHSPRRATPRLRIETGSVGIGGKQTGIYPKESPGGWNIIGNCPIPLFNVNAHPPCAIAVGDTIKFYPISKPKYDLFKIEVETGVYSLKPESNA